MIVIKQSSIKEVDMGGRFSRLNQAERLMAAKTEMDKWRKMNGEERSALYKATKGNTGNKKTNNESVTGYIRPFGTKLADNVWVETRLLAATISAGDTAVEESPGQLFTHLNTVVYDGGYASRDKPAAGAFFAGIASPSKLARVTLVLKGAKNPNGIVSRITKNKYTYYKTDSLSTPFGLKTGGDAEQLIEENALAIRQALETLNTNYKTYFKEQKFLGIAKS